MIIIELSDKQEEKFEAWKESFGKLPYIGATGGHFGINVIFTSIGEIIHGIAWNDERIDLTDYDSF